MLSISPPRRPQDAIRYFASHLRPAPTPISSLEPDEQPGHWQGSGAAALALGPDVSLESFSRALIAVDNQERKLAANGGDPHRRGGWDLTLSAPKSFSVCWALAESAEANSLLTFHQQAVNETLEQVERECLITRRGKGGAHKERGTMVVAVFQHVTNRANDPHVHSHCFVCNLTQRHDGSWGTIESRFLFRRRIDLGRLYQQRLATHLQEDGYPVEQVRDTVRISSVPIELERLFSSRRAAIELCLITRGWTTARGAEIAALETRPSKKRISLNDLRSQWVKRIMSTSYESEPLTEIRQMTLT